MADDGKTTTPQAGESKVPGDLENWGTQTKNARPSSVGQHDPLRDPGGDDSGPGLDPEQYKNPDHADEASHGPAGHHATVPVKEATNIKPGAKRDAPPMRSTVEE
jgi:hypothetical protein